jgi:hypothetical protein
VLTGLTALAAQQSGKAPGPDNSVWTDPATKLTWTRSDNAMDSTWQQAVDHCRSLQSGGAQTWRLPTIDELQTLYDKSQNVNGYHVKGNLQLSGSEWSSTPNSIGERVSVASETEAWFYTFALGRRYTTRPEINSFFRALCVRDSGK